MRRLFTVLAAFATLTTGVVGTVAAPEAAAQSWRGDHRADTYRRDYRRDDRRRFDNRRNWRGNRDWRYQRDRRAQRDWRRDRRHVERRWAGRERLDTRRYGYRGPCNYIRRNGRVVCG